MIGLEIRGARELSAHERELLRMARIDGLAPLEAWTVRGTNRQLAYSTHGIFRFFGKFPPPLARHLIETFTRCGERVLDPMVGSGTTAVEALAAGRDVTVRDVSPLSLLLCRTKTTRIEADRARAALAGVQRRMRRGGVAEPDGLRDAPHWFRTPTLESIGRIRAAIDGERDAAARDLLLTALVSTIRRVSKATTQQGRLFLDVKKARADAWPTFVERFGKYAAAVSALPERRSMLEIESLDARVAPADERRFRLAITHPPYFNNYKYSSINSLELAWLGVEPRTVRAGEIREAFKLGRPEKVREYVQDLAAAVHAVSQQLEAGGVLALMMGDTTIREAYIDVTRQLLGAIQSAGTPLALKRVVLRVPQYTEASWVASQRRTGKRIGVTLHDFVLLFARTDD